MLWLLRCENVKMCESCFRIIELQMYNWKWGATNDHKYNQIIYIDYQFQYWMVLYFICSVLIFLCSICFRNGLIIFYLHYLLIWMQFNMFMPLLWCFDGVVYVICLVYVCVSVLVKISFFLGKLIQLCILWSIYMNLCWIIRLSKSNFVPYLISFLSFFLTTHKCLFPIE